MNGTFISHKWRINDWMNNKSMNVWIPWTRKGCCGCCCRCRNFSLCSLCWYDSLNGLFSSCTNFCTSLREIWQNWEDAQYAKYGVRFSKTKGNEIVPNLAPILIKFVKTMENKISWQSNSYKYNILQDLILDIYATLN